MVCDVQTGPSGVVQEGIEERVAQLRSRNLAGLVLGQQETTAVVDVTRREEEWSLEAALWFHYCGAKSYVDVKQ